MSIKNTLNPSVTNVFVIIGGTGDLNDEKLRLHREDRVRTFSYQGMAKIAEWLQFGENDQKKEGR